MVGSLSKGPSSSRDSEGHDHEAEEARRPENATVNFCPITIMSPTATRKVVSHTSSQWQVSNLLHSFLGATWTFHGKERGGDP